MSNKTITIAAFQIQCAKKECLNFPECSVSKTDFLALRPFYPRLQFVSNKDKMDLMQIHCKDFQDNILY